MNAFGHKRWTADLLVRIRLQVRTSTCAARLCLAALLLIAGSATASADFAHFVTSL